jgi:hypothetical protein
VTKAAEIALDCLADGNGDEAVWWTMLATGTYGQLRYDYLMKGIVNYYQMEAGPAVRHKKALREGKGKQREKTKAKADAAIDDALALIHGGLGKTDAQRRAAKKHSMGFSTLRGLWPKYLD